MTCPLCDDILLCDGVDLESHVIYLKCSNCLMTEVAMTDEALSGLWDFLDQVLEDQNYGN